LNKITIENRRWDPFTAFASSMIGTAVGLLNDVSGIVVRPYEVMQQGGSARGKTQVLESSEVLLTK
jgi:hypothetical protein